MKQFNISKKNKKINIYNIMGNSSSSKNKSNSIEMPIKSSNVNTGLDKSNNIEIPPPSNNTKDSREPNDTIDAIEAKRKFYQEKAKYPTTNAQWLKKNGSEDDFVNNKRITMGIYGGKTRKNKKLRKSKKNKRKKRNKKNKQSRR